VNDRESTPLPSFSEKEITRLMPYPHSAWLAIVVVRDARTRRLHHHPVRKSMLMSHLWALVICGIRVLWHRSRRHRSPRTAVGLIAALRGWRCHIGLWRHSRHWRGIHGGTVRRNTLRIGHRRHVGATHVPSWRSTVRRGHHMRLRRLSSWIRIRTVIHHRVAGHAGSLSLSCLCCCRVFFI